MKKFGILFLIFGLLLSLSFTLSQEDFGSDIGEEDVKKIENLQNNYSPIDESGDINFSKYDPFKSKAEKRIDEINLWLDENVGWMKYIFHMKPQISWLFAFNIYFILLFVVILILNSRGLFFFIEKRYHEFLFGVAIFISFMVSGLYVGLAKILDKLVAYIFGILLPSSLILGIILIFILLVLLIFAYPALMAIFRTIETYREAKKKVKQAIELSAGTEAVNTLIKEAVRKD